MNLPFDWRLEEGDWTIEYAADELSQHTPWTLRGSDEYGLDTVFVITRQQLWDLVLLLERAGDYAEIEVE